MPGPVHERLKSLAARWLACHGVRICAPEVLCPLARYRIDVAAYLDPLPKTRAAARMNVNSADLNGDPSSSCRRGPMLHRAAHARTIIIECKASRADLLRNTDEQDELVAERNHLARQRLDLERDLLIPRARSEASSDRSEPRWLFAELSTPDPSTFRSPTLSSLNHRLERLHQDLHGRIKFETMARYALADELIIAAPTGLFSGHEIPPGWTLIEFRTDPFVSPEKAAEPIRVRPANPVPRPSHPKFRARLLRNIAVAACRAMAKAEGADRADWPAERTPAELAGPE